MLTTRFTRLVGCAVPIQQAGMGAAAPPELAAAVSEAGAFGMLGTARAGLNATTFARLLEQTRQLTTRPFGVNFIMRPGSVAAASAREFIEQAAKVSRLVEFFDTDPSAEFVRIVHDHGALASWQVGSRGEALAAADIGCDLIVAQGIEAGGHVRGTIGLLSLLSDVLDAVPSLPVLAAGGIGTGRAMAAALAAGADGVRVGTRFVDKLLPLLGFDARSRGSAVIEGHEKHVVWYEHPRLGFTITSPRRAFAGETINRRKPGALHHLAFKVASRAEVDRLPSEPKGIGATIVSSPRGYPEYTPPGYYALFFKDMEGIKYEIVCTGHS